jgi:hypothetical protein
LPLGSLTISKTTPGFRSEGAGRESGAPEADRAFQVITHPAPIFAAQYEAIMQNGRLLQLLSNGGRGYS